MSAAIPANSYAPWSDADLSALRQLVGLELPMAYIARRLDRSPSEVRRKAQKVAIADMIRCPAPPVGLRRRQPEY